MDQGGLKKLAPCLQSSFDMDDPTFRYRDRVAINVVIITHIYVACIPSL